MSGIPWSHLPQEVINAVCMGGMNGCPAIKSRGFAHDPATGWWVCASCSKPKITANAVHICDICQKIFVPKLKAKADLSYMGIMCDTCDPPEDKQ